MLLLQLVFFWMKGIIFRVAETPEAMVDHLKETHLHAIPPRFHKGNYKKVKEKPTPMRPAFQQSMSPISYISNKIFSYLDYTVHMPTQQYHSHNLTLHLDSQEHVLPPFTSIHLANAIAINCGGCILSSAFHSTDDRLFIAIGCVDNPAIPPPPPSTPDGSTVSTVSTVSPGHGPHLPYPRRSFHSLRSEVPDRAGWLSIYETQKHNHQITHTLHIASNQTQNQGFPTQLCWLPSSLAPAGSAGILAALWSSGDLDVFHVPRSLASGLWIDLVPAVRIHFTRRITAFAAHPMYGEILLAGLEDGSLRSIELLERNGRLQWVGPRVPLFSRPC